MEKLISSQLPSVTQPPVGLSASQHAAWLLLLPVLTVQAYDNTNSEPLVALLTGEAGAGKTWLAGRMRAAAEAWWQQVEQIEYQFGSGDEYGNGVDWADTTDWHGDVAAIHKPSLLEHLAP